MNRMCEPNGLKRSREEEQSRSGSDNMDGGASCDEQDAADNPPNKKKRYHRHTPQQIQELEAYAILVHHVFVFKVYLLRF